MDFVLHEACRRCKVIRLTENEQGVKGVQESERHSSLQHSMVT